MIGIKVMENIRNLDTRLGITSLSAGYIKTELYHSYSNKCGVLQECLMLEYEDTTMHNRENSVEYRNISR